MENESRSIKKYIIMAITFLVVICLAYLLLRMILTSVVTVTIEGSHNPVTDVVTVNDKRVFPSGKDGKLYKNSSTIGNKVIVLTGPFIEKQSFEVTNSPLSNPELNITTKQSSESEVATSLIDTSTGVEITEVRKFSSTENNWLTIKTASTTATENRELYLYNYDHTQAKWVLIEKGAKVSPYFEGYQTAPKNLLAYLETEAGD